MQSVINSVKGTAHGVAEYLTPVLKVRINNSSLFKYSMINPFFFRNFLIFYRRQESRFRETGVLTPEEFVAAGDHLVHHCPTWQWATGDQDRIKSYLPKNKQFLLTRNVPCSRRCKQVIDILLKMIFAIENNR